MLTAENSVRGIKTDVVRCLGTVRYIQVNLVPQATAWLDSVPKAAIEKLADGPWPLLGDLTGGNEMDIIDLHRQLDDYIELLFSTETELNGVQPSSLGEGAEQDYVIALLVQARGLMQAARAACKLSFSHGIAIIPKAPPAPSEEDGHGFFPVGC